MADNTMQHKLPEQFGGHIVELETDGISEGEYILGYVDAYGTITSADGERIGDLVSVKDNDEPSAVIITDGKFEVRLG